MGRSFKFRCKAPNARLGVIVTVSYNVVLFAATVRRIIILFGRNRVLILVCMVLLATGLTTGKTRKMQRVTTGIWGGVHFIIEVNDRSGSITYDCATGTITGPLTFARDGRFSWRGTFKRERPGPTRIDDAGNESPVIYAGTVVGNE